MKKLLFIIIATLMASSGYCQDTQALIGQLGNTYTGVDISSSGLTGGFSPWGLMGGVVFGSIGFISFVYGKKNSEWKPMIIGIVLMVYPYFLRGTIPLYIAGITLTSGLFFFRE
jgi:hypothetical protein